MKPINVGDTVTFWTAGSEAVKLTGIVTRTGTTAVAVKVGNVAEIVPHSAIVSK
jgi:acyl-CoA hydrolase